MKEVTQREFYEKIGPLDAVINTTETSPLITTEIKMRHTGEVIGKTITDGYSKRQYYLKIELTVV